MAQFFLNSIYFLNLSPINAKLPVTSLSYADALKFTGIFVSPPTFSVAIVNTGYGVMHFGNSSH